MTQGTGFLRRNTTLPGGSLRLLGEGVVLQVAEKRRMCPDLITRGPGP